MRYRTKFGLFLLAGVTMAGSGSAAAQAPAASTNAPAAVPQAPVASLQRAVPAPVSPRFNDVMTAVIYADPGAVTQLLDLGRWVDKPKTECGLHL